MRQLLVARKMAALAAVMVAVCLNGAERPPAPGSYANCEVLSYSSSTAAAGKGARLLSAPAAGAAETVETWVVRSSANTNRTFAVRRTLLSSGGISMCAYTPNRVLATLAAGKSYATFVQEMAAKGLTVVRELMRDLDGNAVYVIEAAETENDIVEQMTISIESTGSCSMVRPDHIYEANAVPNDTNYANQWALAKIGAPQAWDTRTDSSSVLVAVLDTGVNYNHYDLNGSLWENDGEMPGDGVDNDGNGIVDDIYGMASIGGNVSGNSMDDNGHGSHCAGIIGACGNNRNLISGVAWKARIMSLKFLDEAGRGSVSDAITCLRYAEDHGVRIVNCSFGSTDWDDYLYVQMKKMSQQGTIFVCAAGNASPGTSPRDNDEYPFYPCNYQVDTLVSVAATDSNDALANFSYYGAQNVDIAAPGVEIYSTVLSSRGLGYKSGTSMATPHVTGALALLMAHYPGETSAQVIQRLYAAAEPVSALAGKVRTGARLSMAGFFGIAPPTEISVSQGTVNDAVVLYWTSVANGTHYRVWRASAEDGEKTMLCDWRQGLTFSDETAEPGVTNWYYLQAASSAEGAMASTFSQGVSGYRPAIDTSRITVSFNPVGGTVTPASKVYRIGETYSELPTPAYSGKAFLGWFTAASGGTRLDEPSIVRADATTLYAQWVGADVLRVENIFARQRYPWNGYVDVTFDLFGVPNDETASVSLTAREEAGGSPLALRTFVGPAPTNLVNGAQHVVWNATPDTQGILYTNLILAATVAIDEKPLLPPANVSASNATDSDAVVVTWSASENATSYEVWRATANNSSSASKIASPTTTSYRDTSAVPATTYWYWVKAVNSKKTSEFSASASGSRKKIATGISISGSASVTAGGTATYTCTATYNDNSTATVTPTWSITSGSSYASISSSGVLSANGTATSRSVTIQASYSYNGSTQTMTKNVTINTKSVTITFNANGGSVSPTSQSYTAYGAYGSLPTPTAPTGYTFSGWFTDANGGTQVTTSATVPAAATTLYAHWTANTYSVTLNQQSGSGGSSSATATYGSALPSITVPTRTGYTFGGYYTSTGGSGTQYYTASGTSARTWDKTSATTLYAKWTANTYTVTLDRQSGSGGSSSVTATYDSAMPSITLPTRSNYTFGGYYTSTGGSGMQYYTASGASARSWDKTSATTLYAKWTQNIPDPPTGLTATQDRTDGIVVSWNASTGATSYEIYRSTSSWDGSSTKIGTSTTTSYTDTTAVGDQTYYYWVKSVASAGMSGFSSSYATGKRVKVLESVEMDGPDALMSECGGYYSAYANYSDGTRVNLQNNNITISTNLYATLSTWGTESGVYYWTLTGKSVDSRQYVYMTASYTYNGVTQTANKTISILPAGNLTYTYRTRPDGTAELTGYKGDTTVTELTLPSSINGLAVTRTRGSWMRNLSSLTRVTIPSSFTEVAGDMFYYCQRLTNVTIPNSVTSIGSSAFSYCSSIQQMVIPSSVKTIGSYAFYYCTSLRQVIIPDSVTSIGNYAFDSCMSLSSVTIPDSVTSLSYAFNGCSALQTVNLPADLSYLYYSFVGCTNLTSFTISSGNAYFKTESGILFNKMGTELISYPANRSSSSYTIPSTVTTIGANAFYQSQNLTSLTIPASVTTIGANAFCQSQNLTSLTIPASVTSIGYDAFYDCRRLQTISVASANPNYRSVDGILYNKNKTTLIAYPSGKTATAFCMSDSVRSNSEYYGSTNLTNLVWSDATRSISGFGSVRVDSFKTPNCVAFISSSPCMYVDEVILPFGAHIGTYDFETSGFAATRLNMYCFGEWIGEGGYDYFYGTLGSCSTYVYYFDEAKTWATRSMYWASPVHWSNPILALEIDGENKVFAGCSMPLYAKGSFESGHFGIASKADWMVVNGSSYAAINPSNGVLTANANVTSSRTVGVYAYTTLGGASAYANTYNVQIVPANTNTALIAIGKYAYNRLRWLPYPNAVKYNIRRGTSSTYSNATVIDTYLKETLDGTETYVDDTAALGTTYYYWVEALDANGNSLNVTDRASAYRMTGDLSYVRNVLANYDLCIATNDMQNGVLKEIAYWKGVNSTWMTHIQNNDLSSITGANEMFWRSMYDLNTYIGQCVRSIPTGTSGTTYCVIDLSGGPNATSYPVRYFGSLPGGVNTGMFKTTKLVLRKISAGTFTMGCETSEVGYYGYEAVPHSVTISQPFYIGVFEVTQKQYELVMGSNPSSYIGDKRPVENVSYNMIRGSSDGAGWPGSSALDATSFMGKLRAKTGISTFDLPTEAKWEYVCRAGTTTALNSGKNLASSSEDANMAEVGRYYYNQSDGKGGYTSGHTTVGSYKPNNWGLYDMHGNVWEWTLDWYQGRSSFSSSAVTDPTGPASGSYRVLRGGSWDNYAQGCRSAYRGSNSPSYSTSIFGFRLCCSAGQ